MNTLGYSLFRSHYRLHEATEGVEIQGRTAAERRGESGVRRLLRSVGVREQEMAGGGHGSTTYKGMTMHHPKRWHVVTGKGLCAVMWYVIMHFLLLNFNSRNTVLWVFFVLILSFSLLTFILILLRSREFDHGKLEIPHFFNFQFNSI